MTVSSRERRWALIWAVVIVGLTSLPYLLAWQLAPAGTQYTGLLVNPLDGESYYAKMQEGARGDWLFRLPFTSEPQSGAFVYTLYLALGHLAAALGLPIPIVYHLARLGAGMLLLLAAYQFIARFFDRVSTRRAAFLLLGFSAGLGWLLAPLGLTTADLWVAEGFTFLSILINPHFPLALALMLLIFIAIIDLPADDGHTGRRLVGAAAASLALAVVHPIAVPITLAILGVHLLLLAWHQQRIPWRQMAGIGSVGVAAAPLMLNALIAFTTNPALAAWSAQNLTPSLPPWSYILGYGLVLLLALGGAVLALRRRQSRDLFLLAWVGSTAVLLYLPFALQRRFITGLHIPLVLLAAIGLEQIVWPRIQARSKGLVTASIIAFTALTSLFVPAVAVGGVARGLPPLVMSQGEAEACAWLHDNTAWTDTVLTPPETGQFIPAWAGNRVVYGHPFETIDARAKEAEVARFYSGEANETERQALLERYGVRYILVHPLQDNPAMTIPGLTAVWSGGDVTLYGVEEKP
jgi:hypothetical protein